MDNWTHPFRNEGPGSTYRFADATVVGRESGPCPVCGHPTGDCAGESKNVDFLGKTSMANPELANHFLVEEDVIVEKQITPYTKSRVLVHKKGSYISLARARELGLIQ